MNNEKLKTTTISFLFLQEMVTTYLLPMVSIRDSRIIRSQAKVLRELRARKRMNLTELARELTVTNQAMTNISKFLVKEGYIRRVYNESNRRQIELELTEKGIVYVDCWEEEVMEQICQDFSVLSEEECDLFLEAINTTYQILDKTAFGQKYEYKKEIEKERKEYYKSKQLCNNEKLTS